ncbi:MAG: hypothetical protein QW779_07235 [Nitrososphaerales archaeon]
MVKKNTLSNPLIKNRFMSWVERNISNPKYLTICDWQAEFGNDLTFNEAINMALSKYPTIWKENVIQNHYQKIKQIVFIKPLIEKILNNEVQVSYRKTPKIGYYYVIDNRFKPCEPKIILEFYKYEKVNPYKLTDDAKLAGIDNADEIRNLFRKWYGDPIPMLFRNWFKVVSIG